MIQQSLVSVCIANYNGMAVIDDCIRSVLAQQGGVDVEIVVHDDASTDGSSMHIRESYPHVKLIESPSNAGFCIANNRMAAASLGQYILLLNNDAVLYPDALETLLLEAHQFSRPAILSLPQYDARSGELIDRGCLLDPFFNPVPNLNPQRRDVAMAIGACLWIPSDIWQELGGFPEWFESIAEDMYLCCRARLAGYAVRVVTKSGYLHWQGSSFGGSRIVDNLLSTTFRRRSLSERNKTFVMTLTCPAPFFYCLLPLHLTFLLIEGVVLASIKRERTLFNRIYLGVVSDLWREHARLAKLRRWVQRHRKIGRWTYFETFTWLPHKLRLLLKHGVPQIR